PAACARAPERVDSAERQGCRPGSRRRARGRAGDAGAARSRQGARGDRRSEAHHRPHHRRMGEIMTRTSTAIALASLLALAACATTAPPAERIVTRDVLVAT